MVHYVQLSNLALAGVREVNRNSWPQVILVVTLRSASQLCLSLDFDQLESHAKLARPHIVLFLDKSSYAPEIAD